MKKFEFVVPRNWVSLLGVVVTTVSAILIIASIAVDLMGVHTGPYTGIFAFLILPGFFCAGLLLFPIGGWLQRKREWAARAMGAPLPKGMPVLDFNDDKTRLLAVLFLAATIINLAILGAATYKGVEVMESTAFCGKTCHTVMQPEYTTYQRSPHSRVKCVECHIGEGASWFVKSKLSGTWQLISVAFNLYSKPIPTPVHNLRPARETCEQCHWPTRFVGDKLKVITHYDEDEANTEKKTVMMIRVGGSQTARSHGIHWHVDPKNKVKYLSDDKRETIGDVELELADGTKRLYKADPSVLADVKNPKWRTMECVDCHNRPSHIYRAATEELELALTEGRIDKNLPFIRREGLKVLKQDYTDQENAYQKMKTQLMAFYTKQIPSLPTDRATAVSKAIDDAAKELALAWSVNVFPKMNIQWDTYKPFIGHDRAPGCFRCHDDSHKSAEGRVIPMECTTCHKLLAQDEKDPKILKDLTQKNN